MQTLFIQYAAQLAEALSMVRCQLERAMKPLLCLIQYFFIEKDIAQVEVSF